MTRIFSGDDVKSSTHTVTYKLYCPYYGQ